MFRVDCLVIRYTEQGMEAGGGRERGETKGRAPRLSPPGCHHTQYTLHPTPYTLHLTPYTLHPTPYTLHPTRGETKGRAPRIAPPGCRPRAVERFSVLLEERCPPRQTSRVECLKAKVEPL